MTIKEAIDFYYKDYHKSLSLMTIQERHEHIKKENEFERMSIKSLEKQEMFLNILFEIQEAVWGMDIPSPTVPEYVEHHKQMQELLALIDTKIKEVEG